MQLDATDLDLVTRIADYHAFLGFNSLTQVKATDPETQERIETVQADLRGSVAELINRALDAAGLPLRPIPTRHPLPGVAARVPLFAQPKALEIPTLHK